MASFALQKLVLKDLVCLPLYRETKPPTNPNQGRPQRRVPEGLNLLQSAAQGTLDPPHVPRSLIGYNRVQ